MMSDVERGFSFMPEISLNEMNLQYVEDNELKQVWKSSRRERIKLQEQKIWEEFIQEQDIVQSVCESDPYQFIEELPDTYVEEILTKVSNKEQEVEPNDADIVQEKQSECAANAPDTQQGSNNMCSAEAEDNHNVLHIFHDEVDNEEQSGTEGEALDESVGTPCTVREKETEYKPHKERQVQQIEKQQEPNKEKISSKSSDNIASVIENSIYCAKVKDLRIKINEEILSIITSLECMNLSNEDPEDIKKMLKRSTEFCARFSRIHLYQLQRQVHDAERSCSTTAGLVGGRHTQLQAQLLRLTSLHHNVLQAFAALHKCVRQGGFEAARGARDVIALLRTLPPPPRAPTLYQDDLLFTCDKLDVALDKHDIRMAEVVRSIEEPSKNPYASKTGQLKVKKKSAPTSAKSSAKTASRADGNLSMYSIDTLQMNFKGKTSSRDLARPSGTAKSRGSAEKTSEKQTPKRLTQKNPKKSPIKKRGRHDADVSTMVEAVQSCASSQASFERTTRSLKETRRSKNTESSRKSGLIESSRSPATTRRSPNGRPPNGRSPHGRSPSNAITTSMEARSRVTTPRTPTLPDDCAASCEVTRLLRELCGGDSAGNKKERVSGARNAQLHCVSSTTPQTPTMPQILRILEETIQKKSPRSTTTQQTPKDTGKYRMAFNISDKTVESLMQYRTKFVQHMLTSVMYANSSVEKPWEMVNCVSEQIVNELLLKCAKEMQLQDFVRHLYDCETK